MKTLKTIKDKDFFGRGEFPNDRTVIYYADRLGQWIGEYWCCCSTASFNKNDVKEKCEKCGKDLIVKPFKMSMKDFVRHKDMKCSELDLTRKIPIDPQVTDYAIFGADQWVYCSQHLRPHLTGWCSVWHRDKIGLCVSGEDEAYQKCKRMGLQIYKEPIKG